MDQIFCECSYKTIDNIKYYCEECWDIIKINRKCYTCPIDINTERLYVSVLNNECYCKKCFFDKKLII